MFRGALSDSGRDRGHAEATGRNATSVGKHLDTRVTGVEDLVHVLAWIDFRRPVVQHHLEGRDDVFGMVSMSAQDAVCRCRQLDKRVGPRRSRVTDRDPVLHGHTARGRPCHDVRSGKTGESDARKRRERRQTMHRAETLVQQSEREQYLDRGRRVQLPSLVTVIVLVASLGHPHGRGRPRRSAAAGQS